MADPLTHAMLGACCAPDHPIIGAAFGLLPDAPQLPMNIYTLIRYRRTAVNHDWALAPRWLLRAYNYMHGLFIPAAIMFYSWMFIPPLFPFALAYCAHVTLDAFLHYETSIMYPLLQISIIGSGKDWWTDWKTIVFPIATSLIFMSIRLGWI